MDKAEQSAIIAHFARKQTKKYTCNLADVLFLLHLVELYLEIETNPN